MFVIDYCSNLTTAHPVVKVCAADSQAIPSLYELSGSLVKVLAELSFSLSPFGKRLYVNPGFQRPFELNTALPFPGIHVRPVL